MYLYKKTTSATEALIPIPARLTRDITYNPGKNISRYTTPDDLLFYAFQEDLHTISNNAFKKYLMVACYIPDIMGVTEDIRGIFLIKTPKEREWDINDDIIKDKSVGKHGCGYRIDLGFEEKTQGDGKIVKTRRAFQFGKMRSYPFLLRNLTVGFFHTDPDSVDDRLWSDITKNWDGVGLEEPLVFDADFDLFKTRNVTLHEIK